MRLLSILLFGILLPHIATGQSGAEEAVGKLFSDITQEEGNIFLLNSYTPTTKLEYLYPQNDHIKDAIELVKAKKMKFVELNYSQVKEMIVNNRIKSREEYSIIQEFEAEEFRDSARNEKLVDALQKRINIELNNIQKGINDTILQHEMRLIQRSSLDKNYSEYYRHSHKKLWMIESVYESNEYFIIFSILMAGNNQHTAIQRADLILK